MGNFEANGTVILKRVLNLGGISTDCSCILSSGVSHVWNDTHLYVIAESSSQYSYSCHLLRCSRGALAQPHQTHPQGTQVAGEPCGLKTLRINGRNWRHLQLSRSKQGAGGWQCPYAADLCVCCYWPSSRLEGQAAVGGISLPVLLQGTCQPLDPSREGTC